MAMLQDSSKREQDYDAVTWSFQHGYFDLYPAHRAVPGLPTAARPFLRDATGGAGGTISLHNLEGLTPPSLPHDLSAEPSPLGMEVTEPNHVQMVIMPNTESQHSMGAAGTAAAHQLPADHPTIHVDGVEAASVADPTSALSATSAMAGVAGQPPAEQAAGTTATGAPSTAALQQMMMQQGGPMLTITIPDPSMGDTNESANTFLAITPGSVTWPASYPVAAALTQQEPSGPGAAAVAAATAAGWDWQHPEAAVAYAAAVNAAMMTSAGPAGLGSSTAVHPAGLSNDLQQYRAAVDGDHATAERASLEASTAPNPRFEALEQLTAFMNPAQGVGSSEAADAAGVAGAAASEHLLQLGTTDIPVDAVEPSKGHGSAGRLRARQQRNKQQHSKQHKATSGRRSSRRYLPGLFDQWAVPAAELAVLAAMTSAGQTAPSDRFASTVSSAQEHSSSGGVVPTAAQADPTAQDGAASPSTLVTKTGGAAAAALEVSQWLQQQVQQQQVLQEYEAAAAASGAAAAAKAEQYGSADVMWVMEAEAAAERAGAAANASAAAKSLPASPARATGDAPDQVTDSQRVQDTIEQELEQQQDQKVPASTSSGSGSQRQGVAGIRKLLSPGVYSFGGSPLNSPTASMAVTAGILMASPSPVQSRAPAPASQLLAQQQGGGPAILSASDKPAGTASAASGLPELVSSSAALGSGKPATGFLSDQFAAPQSAVAALMELQLAAAVADSAAEAAHNGLAGSDKPSSKKGGIKANRGVASLDRRVSWAAGMEPPQTAAATAPGAGVPSSLQFGEVVLGGSPRQPLFTDNSRLTFASPSALQHLDSSADYLEQAGGAISLMHMNSMSPGRSSFRGLPSVDNSTPRGALPAAGGVSSGAGGPGLFTPEGKSSSRKSGAKTKGSSSLQSLDAIFKTPKAPPLKSYMGGLGAGAGLITNSSGFHGQLSFGGLSRDNSIMAAINLASPADWAGVPAASAAAAEKEPLPRLQTAGAAAEPAPAVNPRESGLAARLGALFGDQPAARGAVEPAACAAAAPGSLVNSPKRPAGTARSPLASLPAQHPQSGAGSPNNTSSWDAAQLMTSPGTLIPKNPLSSFYLMSPTTYTWTRPEPVSDVSKAVIAAAEGGTAVSDAAAEPTAVMLSRLLAPPVETKQQGAAVAASPESNLPGISTQVPTASGQDQDAAATTALAPATDGMVENTGSSNELVTGAELLLGLAAMAVDEEEEEAPATAESAAMPDEAAATSAAVESAGVRDAATALVMLSPRKRARKPKITSPSAATSEPALLAANTSAKQPVPAFLAAERAGAYQQDGDSSGGAAVASDGGEARALPAAATAQADVPSPLPDRAPFPLQSLAAASGQARASSAKKRARGSKGKGLGSSSSKSKKKGSRAASSAGTYSHRLTAVQQQALLNATQQLVAEDETSLTCAAIAAAAPAGAMPVMAAALHIKQEPQEMPRQEVIQQESQVAASYDLAERVRAMLAQPPSPSHLTRPSSPAHEAAAVHDERTEPDAAALEALSAAVDPATAAAQVLLQSSSQAPIAGTAGHVADGSLKSASAAGIAAALQPGMVTADSEVYGEADPSALAAPAAADSNADGAGTDAAVVSHSRLSAPADTTATAAQELDAKSAIDSAAAGPADVIAALRVIAKPFELPAWLIGSQLQQPQVTNKSGQQQLKQLGLSTEAAATKQAAAAVGHDLDPELFTPGIRPRTRRRAATALAASARPAPAAGVTPAATSGLDILSAAAEAAAAAARQAVTSAFRTRPNSLAAAGTAAAAAASNAAAVLSPPASAGLLVAATPVLQAPRPAPRNRSTAKKPPLPSKTVTVQPAAHRAEHPNSAIAATSVGVSAEVVAEVPAGLDPAHGVSAPAPAAAAGSITPVNELVLQPYYIDPSSPEHVRLRPKRAAAKDADARRKQQQEQQSIPLQVLTKGAAAVRVKQEPVEGEEQQQHGQKRKKGAANVGGLVAGVSGSEVSNKHSSSSSHQQLARDSNEQQPGNRQLAVGATGSEVKGSKQVRKNSSSTGLDLLAAVGEAAATDPVSQVDQQQLQQQRGLGSKQALASKTAKNSMADDNEESNDEESDVDSDGQAGVSAASGTSSDSWHGGSSGADDSDQDSDYGKAKRSGKRRAASAPPAAASKRSRQPPERGPSSSSVNAASRRSSPAPAGSQGGSAAAGGSSSGTAAAAAAPTRVPNPKGGRPLGAGNRGQMVPRFTDQSGNLKFGCRSTVYTGVYRCKRNTVRWRTQFSYGGKVLNVGSFPTELDAARAWNAAAIHFRGRDTWLNPVDPALPEDGGVSVAEKLPQPPWGSLLLNTINQAGQEGQEDQPEQAAAGEA